MKKQKSVVRVGGGGEESRHPELAAVVAAEKMETGEASRVRCGNVRNMPVSIPYADSAGDEGASVAGCNVNNANASVRTLNCNNALSNSNSNYAGAFAANNDDDNTEHVSARSSRPNTTEDLVTTGAQGQCDYGSLPFMDGEDKAESNAATADIGGGCEKILAEIKEANSKRKLKSLRRFFINPDVVRMGVERCIKRASDSPEKRMLLRDKEKYISEILKELTDGTYRCQFPQKRIIKKRSKDGKDRNAEIFNIKDRCVQNIFLIIVQEKLTRLIPRTCYSGIKGRSLLSNDKRYCMINQIRTACVKHPSAWVGCTDIEKFYESLDCNLAKEVLFRTIVCPFTRSLLNDMLSKTRTLPIGGTLSQLIAMLVLSYLDKEIIRRYHPQFYASFGDNRIVIDDSREKVRDIIDFERRWLWDKYSMRIKGDWYVRPVNRGFRFCRYDYKSGYVNIRGEMRRHCVRGYKRGSRSYAGYKGIMDKTDSKRLRQMIEKRIRNSVGMNVRKMIGTSIKIDMLVGKTIVITDYEKIPNGKDSEYYYKFQCIAIEADGQKTLYVCRNGSMEVKEFFSLVEQGKVQIGTKQEICQEGNVFFFKGYHTTASEALAILCQQFNIE